MHQVNKEFFRRGLRDGLPIMAGYLAVAFTLGIAARNSGLSAFEAALASLLNNASAGEYAGFTVIKENTGYLEMAIMIFIANARYMLMSCVLSQKLSRNIGIGARMLIGFDVTDEIFGLSISQTGWLNPWYTYGLMAAAVPGWTIGTYLGVAVGNVLPARLVSALSVGLYSMFIAVIIPSARRDRVLLCLIALSMAASFAVAKLPLFSFLSSGMRVIVLTVVLSAAAAVLFPRGEVKDAA